jgi:hypothetical protein
VTDKPTEPPFEAPPWLDAPPVSPSPYQDSHDLRTGPDLHPALLGLLPYVGIWRGRGVGGYPTISDDFHFAQEIRYSHDGRPFLAYESRAWLIEEDGTPIRPSAREVGWIRPVMIGDHAGDEVEALFTTPTGIMELHVGRLDGLKMELVSDAVIRTSTAKSVTAEHRLYGIVDGVLLYAQEMAAVGQPLQSHLSARLVRVAG